MQSWIANYEAGLDRLASALRVAFQDAEVAELADATVSNTVGGNPVRVQIPASAPRTHARNLPVTAGAMIRPGRACMAGMT
jgi:hypothetical protein